MSIYAPDPFAKKLRGALLAVLLLSGIALGFVGAGLFFATESQLILERTGPGTFRVIRSSFFVGHRYYVKTIEGVTEVIMTSAARDLSSDSITERQRRERQKSLDFYGANRARIGWDREDDLRQIEDFMRGLESRLALVDSPSRWQLGISWLSIGFGTLIFIGAVRSNLFPRTGSLSGLP